MSRARFLVPRPALAAIVCCGLLAIGAASTPVARAQEWTDLIGLEARRSPSEAPERVKRLALPTPFDALRVLVIGDSWAQYMWDDGSHTDLLDRFGLADAHALSLSLGSDPGPGYTGPEVAVSGSEVRQWVDTANYPWLANSVALLEANPSIDWVMLSIGGNDILAGRSDGGWYKDMDLDAPGSEEALFQRLEADTRSILDTLLAVRPSLRVLVSSYDYPNFNVGLWCFLYACPKREDLSRDPVNDLITDAELNAMMVLLEGRRRDLCATYERVVYDNSIGLMHHVYGDGLAGPRVLPKPGSTDPLYEPFPGGNPLRPSLRSVFRRPGGVDADPIHLDFEGYQIKIGHQMEAHLLAALRGVPTLSLASRGAGEDGWSDGVMVGTSGVRVGDAGGRPVVGVLSFDTSSLPAGVVIERAAVWLTRTAVAGASGVNPFVSGALGVPAVDVIGGVLGASAQVEPGDALATLDPLAPDQAVDAAVVVGSGRADGYTLRLELDADARAVVNTGGLTQLRLRFPLVDAGDDYVGFAGGDAGAWSPQTVSTFAEVAGSARPVLDLTYDPSTAVADGDRPGGPSTRGLFLAPPAPNPFNPSTVLVFSLERTEASAQLAVYDAAGRLVRVLHHGPLETGTHRRTWDGRDARGRQVASGIYLVRLSGGEGSVTRRAVLTK